MIRCKKVGTFIYLDKGEVGLGVRYGLLNGSKVDILLQASKLTSYTLVQFSVSTYGLEDHHFQSPDFL